MDVEFIGFGDWLRGVVGRRSLDEGYWCDFFCEY